MSIPLIELENKKNELENKIAKAKSLIDQLGETLEKDVNNISKSEEIINLKNQIYRDIEFRKKQCEEFEQTYNAILDEIKLEKLLFNLD
ncbi:hypothetical protein [Spirosoma pollinicola]|uniref:Uncharacterized protein n=1 Tax=Spirosoma pollinicola TaxID=2057025 RepID=A0A2K8YTN3_9BACT|nr:hypothetical protein [Spirosoma pollinicola]AUD00987.1 hypothetical protein CWM47_03620 [Spirosoma pollinicola]